MINETRENQDVYFDDLKITHESPAASFKVSQINEYYPFGLLTKNSWRNPGYEDPGMSYQSYYATYDSLTEYNDFFLRNYEPALGRWLQNDPYSQFVSPYLAMNNTPHVGVDPDGGNWLSAIGGALFTGYTAGLISSGGILNPFDWSREDLNWAAAGFAAGGLLFGTMTDLKVSGGANKGIRGSDGLRNAWSLEWSDFALGIPRAMSSILSVLEPKLHIDNFIIDEKLKRQFELTFSQLDNINRFVRKINKINRNGGVTISSTILPKNNGYKPYFNEIFWAPYDAAVLKDGSIQSPGLLLIHELMHAHQLSKIGYEKFMSKKEVDDPLYTDLTEKYATKKTNQITRRLGLRNVSHRVGYKPGDFEYSIRTLDPLKADFVSFPKSCPFKIRVG